MKLDKRKIALQNKGTAIINEKYEIPPPSDGEEEEEENGGDFGFEKEIEEETLVIDFKTRFEAARNRYREKMREKAEEITVGEVSPGEEEEEEEEGLVSKKPSTETVANV